MAFPTSRPASSPGWVLPTGAFCGGVDFPRAASSRRWCLRLPGAFCALASTSAPAPRRPGGPPTGAYYRPKFRLQRRSSPRWCLAYGWLVTTVHGVDLPPDRLARSGPPTVAYYAGGARPARLASALCPAFPVGWSHPFRRRFPPAACSPEWSSLGGCYPPVGVDPRPALPPSRVSALWLVVTPVHGVDFPPALVAPARVSSPIRLV